MSYLNSKHKDTSRNPLPLLRKINEGNLNEGTSYNCIIDDQAMTLSVVGNSLTVYSLENGKMLSEVTYEDQKYATTKTILLHQMLSSGVIISRFCPQKHDHLVDHPKDTRTVPMRCFHCIRDGQCFKAVMAHSHECWDLAELPNGNFVTASHDRTIAIWSGITFELISRATTSHDCHSIKLLDCSTDDCDFLVTCDYGGYLIKWKITKPDCSKLEEVKRCHAKTGIIWGLEVTKTHIVSGDSNGWISMWDYDLNLFREWKGHDSDIRTCALLTPNILATGGYDNKLNIWDLSREGLLHSMDLGAQARELAPRFVKTTKRGWLVVGGWTKQILIYDASWFLKFNLDKLNFSRGMDTAFHFYW